MIMFGDEDKPITDFRQPDSYERYYTAAKQPHMLLISPFQSAIGFSQAMSIIRTAIHGMENHIICADMGSNKGNLIKL